MTTARYILAAFSQESGIGMDELLADRSWHTARVRQIAMLLLRERRGLSWHHIKLALRRNDHTTVLRGCRAMRERLKRPAAFPEICALHDRVVARLEIGRAHV